jgi:hypothetical protein
MRVVAQDHEWFVLEVEPDVGRVFDLPRRRLFAPMSLVAILARGTWRDFVGDPGYVFDALSDAEDVPSDQLSLTGEAFNDSDRAIASRDRSAMAVPDRPSVVEETCYVPADGVGSRTWPSALASAIKTIGQFGSAVGARIHGSRSSSSPR